MNRRLLGILLSTALIGAGVLYASIRVRRAAEDQFRQEARAAAEAAGDLQAQLAKAIAVRTAAELKPGTTFGLVLQQMGVDFGTIAELTESARPVLSFRRLRPGSNVVLMRTGQGHVRSVFYRIDPDNELWITRKDEDEGYEAEIRETPSTVRRAAIAGKIDGSLFESVMEAGEGPELALQLAEIFAWDLDFYTDPRPGDTFRVVLEKKEYDNGQPPSYGRILAAEYNNAGRLHGAVLFRDRQGRPAYYSPEGKSLQKAFLRSPLKFAARVSSHYSRRRFHPVLKIYRPHLGTDYAAPRGTPVQAIADGRVVFAGRKGGGGITVRIAHARGYESYYLHLHRALVRSGQRVQQGQRIGLVGATGLATGPHLDFRLRRHQKFVDFEKLALPPAYPVPEREWAAFVTERDRWMALLSAADGSTVAGLNKAQDPEQPDAGQP